jgi:hypothetical protein
MDVRLPDGKVIRNVPDGTTKADLAAKMQRNGMTVPQEWMAPAPDQQQEPRYGAATGYGAVGINAPNKAISGTIDAVLNAPTNLWNLVKAGSGVLNRTKAQLGLAPKEMGAAENLPSVTEAPNFARRAFEGMGLIRQEAQPQTTGQRIFDAGVQGAVGGMMNPSGSIPQTVAAGGAGFLGNAAGAATKEATGSDALAQSVSILAPVAVNATANAARSKIADLQAQQSRNAPRDQALAAGIDAGYKVPPSTVKPTLANKTIESIGGKAATQQDASVNNVEVTDRLARRSIGLPEDAPLTEDATRAVRRQAYQAGYAPIEQAGPISTGRLYRQELDGIVSRYQGAANSFGGVRNDVADMVDGLRRRTFDAGDGIKMSAILRENASQAFRAGDTGLANAQRAAATAIENQIERGLSDPAALDRFRQARQLMARAHTVEDAITTGTGHVNANKIKAELQDGAPLTGELRVIGEFANNFPKAVQTPQVVGSPGVSKVAALASALMGGGGAAALGPVGGAAAAVPFVAPPLARSYLLSAGKQAGRTVPFTDMRLTNGLRADYTPNLLTRGAAQLPDITTGGLFAPLQFAEELKRRQQGQ